MYNTEETIAALRTQLAEAKKHEAICHCGEAVSAHHMGSGHSPVEMPEECPYAAELLDAKGKLADMRINYQSALNEAADFYRELKGLRAENERLNSENNKQAEQLGEATRGLEFQPLVQSLRAENKALRELNVSLLAFYARAKGLSFPPGDADFLRTRLAALADDMQYAIDRCAHLAQSGSPTPKKENAP